MLGDRLRQTRMALLGALLVGLPFGLGGRADWVLPAAGLTNAAALGLLGLELACSGRRLRGHWAWVAAGLWLAVLCLQLAPIAGLVPVLSPNTEALWERARAAGMTDLPSRLSLTPARTRVALAMLAQIGLTGWLVYNTFTTRRGLLLLSACVAGAALANAVAAFAPTYLGGKPLYAALGVRSHPPSGTFLNRNHFGCLLAMGLVQLAGLAWIVFRAREHDSGAGGPRQRTLEERLRRRRGPLLLALVLAAVPVAMGLVFSLSRGAAVGATAGLLTFVLLGTRGSSSRTRRTLLAATGLVLGVILVGAIEALTDLWDRYEALMTLGNIGLDGRWTIWCETVELLRRFPLFGIGLDAFERVSPLVESGFSAGRISFHAHNDYLELLAEAGLPLGILGLALVFAGLALLLRRALRCRDLICRTLAAASWCSLLAVALHEAVDYNLRAPANAFLAVSLAVLCLAAGEHEDARRRDGHGSHGTGRQGPGRDPASAPEGEGIARGRHSETSPWRRGAFAAAGVAAVAAGVWHFPPQIRGGIGLMGLRNVIGAAEGQTNTGAAEKTQAAFCVGKAEEILRDLPDDERALYCRAHYRQVLTTNLCRELAGVQLTPDQMARVREAAIEARETARAVCRGLPTAGYYQARYARELNYSAWYDKSVRIADVVRAFETAHANHPRVPQVSAMCLEAFSEILDVDRDELPAADLARVERLVADMGTALLEQQPDRSAEVLRHLQRVFPEPEKLITVTPPRLLCYEPLYDLLFSQGRYDHCAALLDAMERINRTRLTRQDSRDITLYELTRTHPLSRDEMSARLARRRLTLASARGAGEDYEALRRAERDARRVLCQPLLVSAIEAAVAGDCYRALREGRTAASRFPEVAETYPYLAEWLLSMGERQRALEALHPLMTMAELSPRVIEHALAVAERMLTERAGRDEAALVCDVLRVRRAQAADAPDAGELPSLRERLTSWARGYGRPALVARYGHLALFHAGCAAELSGDQAGAAELYAEALRLCPLHRPSVECLLALPEEVAGEHQERLRSQLEAAGLLGVCLHRDLVVPAQGVVLRHIAVTPRVIDATQAVSVAAAVEITAAGTELPVLHLDFAGADGIRFGASMGAKQWLNAPDRPRIGQLLAARVEITPAKACVQAGYRLPDGLVTLRIAGAERDHGLTFHYPAFEVRRPPPRPGE